MRVNTRIIVASVLLMVGGVYNTFVIKRKGGAHTSLVKIIVGGSVLAIIAALVDLVSPEVGYLAGAVMFLAVLTLAFTILPDLAQRFGIASKTQGA